MAGHNTSASKNIENSSPPNLPSSGIAEVNRFRVNRIDSGHIQHPPSHTNQQSNFLQVPTALNNINYKGPSSRGVDLLVGTPGGGSTAGRGSDKRRKPSLVQDFLGTVNRRMSQAAPRKFSIAGLMGLGRRQSSNLPDLDDFSTANSTVGLYGKTLSRYTQDALPKLENYKDIMSIRAGQRPTLDELHDEYSRRKSLAPFGEEAAGPPTTKFGWIEGCLVRCLLNIWGVMLFLRLSWMVAHAGIIHSMIIIVFSTVVTTITTLSMSAVSTNGEMKGGGIYYMIARSLGPECGGSVGVVFSFANAGMAALNIVGFSESMISLLQDGQLKIVDAGQNDNRVISCITIVVLQSIIVIGMEWEAKAQVGLLVILLVAMTDFVVGAIMGPKGIEDQAKGWVGLNSTVFMANLGPGYRFSEGKEQDFFTVFSIFFPAVAGIQAGASISGDLKDPGEAIPKGTLLAIFITSASYAFFALLAGSGELREASGLVEDYPGNFTNCTGRVCKSGLYNDYQVMQLMSAFGPLIYAGCFAATLSSALSCMVSGSKMFQALAQDNIYPCLARFGVGYGKADDPYWSYALGFLVSLIFILIADLNAIAPLISNFFMATYVLLNFCAFHASLIKAPSWRPTFKYFNPWVGLLGAVLCIVVMFLMDWPTGLISIGCTVILYLIVYYTKPDLNWGTSLQSQTYSNALNSLQRLVEQGDHVKNYRPQILCLTGFPSTRPALVDFANLITKNQSLLLCGHILQEKQTSKVRRTMLQRGYVWLNQRKVKAFYVIMDNSCFEDGAQLLLQTSGIGKLSPNVVLFGYKANWQSCPRDELRDYFNAIHNCLDNNMAVAILKIKEGLDCSQLVSSLGEDENMSKCKQIASQGQVNRGVEFDITDPEAMEKGHDKMFGKKSKKSKNNPGGIYHGPDGTEIPKDIVPGLSLFQTKQDKGTIDVWWLYDDGGLTLLLPYIISQRKNWQQCRLRIFILASKQDQMEHEMKSMAVLLAKFRIDYGDLTVIPDITKKIEDTSPGKALFESIIKEFRGDPESSDCPETVIEDSELFSLKEKTNRHLRLRELLMEHSKQSNLVVMTLPIPRKGKVSCTLYMAWLELLTRDMPPFLLVRGNQSSVLTFYS